MGVEQNGDEFYHWYNSLVIDFSVALVSLGLCCSDQLIFCLKGTFALLIHFHASSTFSLPECVEIFSNGYQIPSVFLAGICHFCSVFLDVSFSGA